MLPGSHAQFVKPGDLVIFQKFLGNLQNRFTAARPNIAHDGFMFENDGKSPKAFVFPVLSNQHNVFFNVTINLLHLMKRSGFQSIGSVSENVPGFDKLTSDIYVVDRETFYKAIAEPQLKRIVDRVNLREILAHKPNTSEPATVTAVSG